MSDAVRGVPACTCSPARAGLRGPEESPALDAVFKALASAQRRELLRLVASGASDGTADVCACRLAEALELAPSTISHHMASLVKAGLVTATKRGLWVYYRVERDALASAAESIAGL